MTKEKATAKDTEFSLIAVPPQLKRQGLWAAMVVLAGFTFFTPSMTAGGNLGIGMNAAGIAVVVGSFIAGGSGLPCFRKRSEGPCNSQPHHGHAQLNNAYCSKLFRLLKMSDINFVSNPLVNTHLQGRFDNYPRRRGVTRVKELLANGNNVSMGHDDIFDPWYPLGDGNMISVVHMGLHVCQMLGYEEILNSYKLITHNAARTLYLGDTYGIKVENPANFIVLNQEDFYQALNKQSEVLLSFREGRLIASTKPVEKRVLF